MNFSNVLILPSLKVHQLEEDVARKSANKTKYTNVERSDAFESLGIAQFYNGNYADAITNLEAAIAPRYIKVKSKKRVAMIKTLVSSRTIERSVSMDVDSLILPVLLWTAYFCFIIVGFALLPVRRFATC